MSESKTSTIETPFKDAICPSKKGGTSSSGGSQKAAAPAEGMDLYFK